MPSRQNIGGQSLPWHRSAVNGSLLVTTHRKSLTPIVFARHDGIVHAGSNKSVASSKCVTSRVEKAHLFTPFLSWHLAEALKIGVEARNTYSSCGRYSTRGGTIRTFNRCLLNNWSIIIEFNRRSSSPQQSSLECSPASNLRINSRTL